MIVAVIVTYEPNPDALRALLLALRVQVQKAVVVDNGSSVDVGSEIPEDHFGGAWCELIRLPTNVGIAAAQNVGIARSRQEAAAFVILFDQDSLPAPGMVGKLREVAQAKLDAGFGVAGVGPRYIDERQCNPPPFIRIRGMSVERLPCVAEDSVVEVDYLIASGCLIPMETLACVGEMREDLFIDYVDIEWGLRARRSGFLSFGVCGARMRHDLGDSPIEFLGRKIPVRSPLRHYYHFRNAVRLYCEGALPLNWKIADGQRLVIRYGFYSLFARPRLRHWGMMSLGVLHGLIGRMGKFGRT